MECQCGKYVYRRPRRTYNGNFMIDGRKPHAVAAVLCGIYSRLHGAYKRRRRRLIVAVGDNKLYCSCAVPRSVGLTATHAGQRFGNVDVLASVKTVCLIAEAIQISCAQCVGAFLILAVYADACQRRRRQAVDVINGYQLA